jgi:double zinc ribbon protein
MGALAVFGIDNDGLNLAVNLLLLFLFVLWVALVYWTYADARRRVEDPMLVGCATAASLFPFIGTVVYLIVRPPEYLVDARERELEIAAAEARLVQAEALSCPYCDAEVEKAFLRCPSCLRRLREPCGVCGKPLDPRWTICPYCEAEVGQAPAATRQRQRRAGKARGGRLTAARPASAAGRPGGGNPASTVESAAAQPSATPDGQGPQPPAGTGGEGVDPSDPRYRGRPSSAT